MKNEAKAHQQSKILVSKVSSQEQKNVEAKI